MTQLTFDLESLDDTRVRELYSCKAHELYRQADAHWDECLKLVCPRCHERSGNAFMGELNHGSVEWRLLCGKQINLLNHAHRCTLIMSGAWAHDPQTNCYAPDHDHSDRKSGNHFAKGVSVACVRGEFDGIKKWLLEHGTPEGFIGLPASRSAVPQPHSIGKES